MTGSRGPVVLGIDFGTSNTVAALSAPGRQPRVLSVDGGGWLPSAVFLSDDGSLAVGRDAERRARLATERFEPNPKRRIDDGDLLLGAGVVPVADAIAAVLSRVGQEARRQLDRGAPDLVTLTHPAQWGPTRRAVLLEAARRAGLGGRVTLLPEPVAAAVHFGWLAEPGSHRPGPALAVYDLGGGTFDCAVVTTENSAYAVAADNGLADVGGVDFDQALLDQLGRVQSSADPGRWRDLLRPQTPADRRSARALHEDVRSAKETLSRYSQAEVPLPEPFDDALLSRSEFEGLIRPMVARTVEVLAATISRSGYSARQLSGIYLVGGSSRIPLVATAIAERIGVVPSTLDQPETAVALGSALWPAVQEHRATGPQSAGPVAGPVAGRASGPTRTTGPAAGGASGPVRTTGSPAGPVPAGGQGPHEGGVGGPRPGGPPPPQLPAAGMPRRRRRAAAMVAVAAAVLAVLVTVGLIAMVDRDGTDAGAGGTGTGSPTEATASTGQTGQAGPSGGTSSAGSSSAGSGDPTTDRLDPTRCTVDNPNDQGLTPCLAAFAGGLASGAECTDDAERLGMSQQKADLAFGTLAPVWAVCIAPDDKYWALLFQNTNSDAREAAWATMLGQLKSHTCGTFQTSERPRGIYAVGRSTVDGEPALYWEDTGLPLLGMFRPPGRGTVLEVEDVLSDFTERSGFALADRDCAEILDRPTSRSKDSTSAGDTETTTGGTGGTDGTVGTVGTGSAGTAGSADGCPAAPLDDNHMSPCIKRVAGAVLAAKSFCINDDNTLETLQSADVGAAAVAACSIVGDGLTSTVIYLQFPTIDARAKVFTAMQGDSNLEPWQQGGFTGQVAFSEPETGKAQVIWDFGDLPVMAVATSEATTGTDTRDDQVMPRLRQLFGDALLPEG